MPSIPFGDHLKRERELRGVTLEEIAAATRISPRFLEALENERWDQLPGGAFNRGFIRSVARYLGLDEENMVAEYALETKGMNQAGADSGAQGMPRDFRPAIAVAVGVVVLILLTVLAIHFYRARARSRAAQQQLELQMPAPASPGGSH